MSVDTKRKRTDSDVGEQPRVAQPSTPFLPLYYAPRAPIPPGTILPTVEDMLDALSNAKIRNVLITAILSDATRLAQSILIDTWYQELAKEQARVINFDHYSRDAWYTLNGKYRKLSGSKQYDAAGDAHEEVSGSISSIGNQVTLVSSYGTKLSALETLRKIGKSILLSGDTIGHEVRKQFQWDPILPETMLRILHSMPPEERSQAGVNVSEPGKGALFEKVNWLVQEAASQCIGGFDDLSIVYDLLTGMASDEEADDVEEEKDIEDAIADEAGEDTHDDQAGEHSVITINSD